MNTDTIDTTAVAVAPAGALARAVPGGSIGLLAGMVSPGEILAVIEHVHAIVKGAMKEGIDGDYGLIPGTGTKKVLLKPGAEKLLLAFSLTAIPRAPIVRELGDGHREITVETEIRSMTTDRLHAVGLGSCSTMEKKYRWRPGPVEITDQPVPREYWDLRKSDPKAAQALIGGPGHSTKKDENGSWMIALKGDDVAENTDIADVYNTVLKIASKRSMVDGTIRATATSALFTQDLDDELGKKPEDNGNGTPPASAAPRTATRTTTPASAAAPAGNGATPTGANVARGVVQRTFAKAEKKPWAIYVGPDANHTEKYTTFSDTIGKAAQLLKGYEAVLTWNAEGPKGEYRTLMSIIGAPVDAEPAPERTAEDEAFDRELAEKGL